MNYKGHNVLNGTTIPNSESGLCMVIPGNWVTWKDKKQAPKENHLPLERMEAQHGVGPYQISQILRTPTQEIVFELLKEGKPLELINEKYFNKW